MIEIVSTMTILNEHESLIYIEIHLAYLRHCRFAQLYCGGKK